jgi:hypothetical protein
MQITSTLMMEAEKVPKHWFLTPYLYGQSPGSLYCIQSQYKLQIAVTSLLVSREQYSSDINKKCVRDFEDLKILAVFIA